MRGTDYRKWPGLCSVLKQYVLWPPLEAKCWARRTLLRSAWVFLLFSNLQKVLKFIVSKDNKLSFQDRASTIYNTVHRCVTGQKDSSLPWKVNAYPEQHKALTQGTVRGKYLPPNPAAQEKWGCCCSMPPGPTSRKMFSLQGHAHKAPVYTIYIHIYGQTYNSHRHSEHSYQP